MLVGPEYRYDVFISFAEGDRDWVEGYLLPGLGLSARRVITNQRTSRSESFRPGAVIVNELERAVTGSRCTLLVLSHAYLADQWSTFGEQLASYATVAEQQERLIPLLRERDCSLPLRIEFRVRLDCTEQNNWESEVARLRELLAQPEPKPERIPCPYPGMIPFREKDARFFYGREDEIKQMLQHFRNQRCLWVIGPSGSGKSSLIFAGLLPKLSERRDFSPGFWSPGCWLVRSIRPGSRPMQELARICGDLSRSGECVDSLLKANTPAERLLLVIDQFEELFTQTEWKEQARFIAALKGLHAVQKCALLFAMRADFYPDLMNSDLWPIDKSQRLEIVPLRGEALRLAIERPAVDVSVYLEAGLVDRILADAADEPGILPLVQEAMVLLWGEMQRRLLTLSAYKRLGSEDRSGLTVAMVKKADATLADLTMDEKAIARRIFLRLVQFGEGRADTRRQQTEAELATLSEDLPFAKTLRHLADNRLLTQSGEEKEAGKRVDIAHETLITGWPQLHEWISNRRDKEKTRRRLDAKAKEWIRLGKGDGGLLDTVELAEAEGWLNSPDATELGYGPDLPALVYASRKAIERVEQEKVAARQRELEQAQALAEERQQRLVETRRLYRRALAHKLAAQAELIRHQQPDQIDLAVLLAIESIRLSPSIESADVLRAAIEHLPLLTETIQLGYRADKGWLLGRYLALADAEHTVRILECDGWREAACLRHARGGIRDVRIDRLRAATTLSGEGVIVWDIAKQKRVAGIPLKPSQLRNAVLSPSGRLVAWQDNYVLEVWDVRSSQAIARILHPESAGYHAVVFSGSERIVATAASPNTNSHTHFVGPDGHWHSTADGEKRNVIRLWRIDSIDKPLATVPYDGISPSIASACDGSVFCVSTGLPHATLLFDAETGAEIARLDDRQVLGFGGDLVALSVSAGGAVMGTPMGVRRQVAFVEGKTGKERSRTPILENPSVVLSPDGTRALTGGSRFSRGMVEVWETRTGRLLARARGSGVTQVAFSPQERQFLTCQDEGQLLPWRLPGLDTKGVPSELEFSGDGKQLVGVLGNHLFVWDVGTGQLSTMLEPGYVDKGLQLSAGRLLAEVEREAELIGAGGKERWGKHRVHVRGLPSCSHVFHIEHTAPIIHVAFDSAESRIAIAGEDGVVRVWDLRSRRERETAKDLGKPLAMAFGPDGELYVATTGDSVVRVLRVRDRWDSGTLPCDCTSGSVLFDQEGTRIAARNAKNISVRSIITPWEASITLSDDAPEEMNFAGPERGPIVLACGSRLVVWDPEFPEPRVTVSAGDRVMHMAVARQRPVVAAATLGRKVTVWDVANDQKLCTLQRSGDIEALAFDSNGKRIAVASHDGVSIEPVDFDELVSEARTRVTRRLTPGEWRLYLEDEPFSEECSVPL
ncbi:TIR domain-containing protein [Bradyrhizobium sp. 200]|uniref:nSTAND1 domain-containing NTPase n=1 Tax=Bradyrhizobium sp. 200 TaxID=2782665 RepID=UPI001FFF7271|nr:TIR domain-containing protein [Bradyrhizobium sp. 200]UPJ49341.1 TIR domain-containing protein [Bradyrhizobium sp. 200]